jgi:hypothetical protein
MGSFKNRPGLLKVIRTAFLSRLDNFIYNKIVFITFLVLNSWGHSKPGLVHGMCPILRCSRFQIPCKLFLCFLTIRQSQSYQCVQEWMNLPGDYEHCSNGHRMTKITLKQNPTPCYDPASNSNIYRNFDVAYRPSLNTVERPSENRTIRLLNTVYIRKPDDPTFEWSTLGHFLCPAFKWSGNQMVGTGQTGPKILI